MNEQQGFALLLGEAAIDVWGAMPRDIQEALFETAMRDRPDLRRVEEQQTPPAVFPFSECKRSR